MKKQNLLLTIGIITVLLGLAACNTTPATPPVPTVEPTEAVAPTTEPTTAPVETTAPTVEPTATPTEPPHEHTWVLTKTEPTCTTDGHSIETCECGEQRNETIYLALGHYTNRIETKFPTYDEEGEWEDVCYICGEVLDRGTSDKLAPPVPPQEAEPEPTATVAPQETVTPAPTDGAHEHVWVEEIVKPDCINKGSYKEVCACGAVQNETTYPAIGHLLERVVTKEATVEEEGEWEEVCKVCGEVTDTGKSDKLMPKPTHIPSVTPTPKATATPTPSPKPTSTPKPTATPAPTRIPVESYTWWDVNHELIRYTNDSCTEMERIWYDLNLKYEWVTLENYSDEVLGEQIEVYVKDYPADDAKTIYTIKKYVSGKTRGQVEALERCVETGWYKVFCGKDNNGKDIIGYVDDKYMKCTASTGMTLSGQYVPCYEYCQFEIPFFGPNHELKQPMDLSLKVDEYGLGSVSMKSKNLYYMLYAPELQMIDNKMNVKYVGVFTIENPGIVEVPEYYETVNIRGVKIKAKNSILYKEGIGYYATNGSYAIRLHAIAQGTTKITLTEYKVYNYQYDEFYPTFELGEVTNIRTFNVTVE